MTPNLSRIEKGIACIEDERSRLRAEQRAFQQFRDAIQSIQPAIGGKVDASSTQSIAVQQQQTVSTGSLLDTYRETIMATDHYDSHYGESLEENLLEEFTPRITRALLSTDRITPLLRRKLFAAVNNCIEQRLNLLDMLDVEHESLRSIRKDLQDITTQLEGIPDCRLVTLSFDELETQWLRLNELEQQCEHLLEIRQRFVTRTRTDIIEISDPAVINEYLYQTLDSHYPVLSTILIVLDRIESRRIDPDSSFHDGPRPKQ